MQWDPPTGPGARQRDNGTTGQRDNGTTGRPVPNPSSNIWGPHIVGFIQPTNLGALLFAILAQVMLRNLPNNYTRDMLLTLLNDKGFAGRSLADVISNSSV